MNLIKHNGPALPSRKEADDTLTSLLALPGAQFGYVDKDNQVFVFFTDHNAGASLMPVQERITLAFPEKAPAPAPEPSAFLQNLGDALMGKGPWARPTR
jgi:hypothetical protein